MELVNCSFKKNTSLLIKNYICLQLCFCNLLFRQFFKMNCVLFTAMQEFFLLLLPRSPSSTGEWPFLWAEPFFDMFFACTSTVLLLRVSLSQQVTWVVCLLVPSDRHSCLLQQERGWNCSRRFTVVTRCQGERGSVVCWSSGTRGRELSGRRCQVISQVGLSPVRGELRARRPHSWSHCAECASGGK